MGGRAPQEQEHPCQGQGFGGGGCGHGDYSSGLPGVILLEINSVEQ